MSESIYGAIDVSWFANKMSNRCTHDITVNGVLNKIRTPDEKLLGQIAKARACLKAGNKDGYSSIKTELPAVTFGGTFFYRKEKGIKRYSNLVVLDIDKISDQDTTVQDLKTAVNQLDYTMACFISPSGDGLKVLVKTKCNIGDHKACAQDIQRYYDRRLSVKGDIQTCDLPRLCFLSHDPELYLNYGSTIYEYDPTMSKALAIATKHVSRYYSIEDGRNRFVHRLSLALNQLGVEQSLAEEILTDQYSEQDFTAQEIVTTIGSGYRNKEQHGSRSHLLKNADKDSRSHLTREDIGEVHACLGLEECVFDEEKLLETLLYEVQLKEPTLLPQFFAFCTEGGLEFPGRSFSRRMIRRIKNTESVSLDGVTEGLKDGARDMKKLLTITSNPSEGVQLTAHREIVLLSYVQSSCHDQFSQLVNSASVVPLDEVEAFYGAVGSLARIHNKATDNLDKIYRSCLLLGPS